MTLAWLLLLTGLTISIVAIYYSVVGLTAIFSAAAIPIIIMGTSLEVGKLVCASWLKANWERAPRFMKYYMITAVIVLMFITSMGIFGFLSKAHNDQNLVSGDVQSKIAIYDEKIKTAKDNIDANRKALKQMDEAVDQVMGRSTDEKGADKAVAIRRGQQKERARLQAEIQAEQKIISQISQERAPIAAEVRKVEAEVGPIKYIAKFIYGEKGADENMLEQAVTWIIIMIVIVFDPLAVIMLLAAQMTFGWRRKEPDNIKPVSINDFVPQPTEFIPKEELPKTEIELEWDPPRTQEQTHTEEVPSETLSTALGGDITAPEEPSVPGTEESELDKWNRMIEEADKEVKKEKSAKTVWKEQNPSDTIKHQEMLKDLGIIEQLPWDELTDDKKSEIASKYKLFPELQRDLTTPEPDFPKQETITDSDQKKNDLHSQTSGPASEEKPPVDYVQNSEQTEESIWQRIKNKS
jgi:hypothetical protein